MPKKRRGTGATAQQARRKATKAFTKAQKAFVKDQSFKASAFGNPSTTPSQRAGAAKRVRQAGGSGGLGLRMTVSPLGPKKRPKKKKMTRRGAK